MLKYEALVEIEEAEEPSITLPPEQRIQDKPANMQRGEKENSELPVLPAQQ